MATSHRRSLWRAGGEQFEKLRWLRKYGIGAGPRIEEIDKDKRPNEGCNVELTELSHVSPNGDDGWHWWTIGFEAFGPPERVGDNLQAGLGEFFAKTDRPPPAPMLEANSMSYPAWFEEIELV